MILGTDWLTAKHGMLNCATKTAVFGTAEPQDPRIVSAKRVKPSVKAGAQVFMMLFSVVLDKDASEKVYQSSRTFPEMFADVDCLPPKRDVELAIDLVMGTGSISMVPHGMSP